jgi:hypothetical protein
MKIFQFKIYTTLLLVLSIYIQTFSQTSKIGIDEQCHIENTKMLIEVLEKTIGEKKIINKKNTRYDYQISRIYPISK